MLQEFVREQVEIRDAMRAEFLGELAGLFEWMDVGAGARVGEHPAKFPSANGQPSGEESE